MRLKRMLATVKNNYKIFILIILLLAVIIHQEIRIRSIDKQIKRVLAKVEPERRIGRYHSLFDKVCDIEDKLNEIETTIKYSY